MVWSKINTFATGMDVWWTSVTNALPWCIKLHYQRTYYKQISFIISGFNKTAFIDIFWIKKRFRSSKTQITVTEQKMVQANQIQHLEPTPNLCLTNKSSGYNWLKSLLVTRLVALNSWKLRG